VLGLIFVHSKQKHKLVKMSVENELPTEDQNLDQEMNQEQASLENQENNEEQLADEYKDKFVRLYAEFDNCIS
jgi:molecular chaperone GrpE (heat shock protein)